MSDERFVDRPLCRCPFPRSRCPNDPACWHTSDCMTCLRAAYDTALSQLKRAMGALEHVQSWFVHQRTAGIRSQDVGRANLCEQALALIDRALAAPASPPPMTGGAATCCTGLSAECVAAGKCLHPTAPPQEAPRLDAADELVSAVSGALFRRLGLGIADLALVTREILEAIDLARLATQKGAKP